MEASHAERTIERRSRTSMLLVVLLVVALVLGLYLAVHEISSRTYTELEWREVDAASDRVQDALADRRDALGRSVSDYALWDDSYEFATGNYPGYIDDNFVPSAMANLGVDFMVVVDPVARTLRGRAADRHSGQAVPLPSELQSLLASDTAPRLCDPASGSGGGIISTSRGPVVFAARRITNTDGTKSLPSFLMAGRTLGPDEVSALSAITHHAIAIHPPTSDSGLGKDTLERVLSLQPGKTLVLASSETSITGLRAVKDMVGDPAFVVSVTVPRTIHQVGEDSSKWLGVSLAVFGVVTCGLVGNGMLQQHREVVTRTHAEMTARASERRHRELIENMADAVLGFDATGAVSFVNSKAVSLLGRAKDDLVGSPCSTLLLSDEQAAVDRRLKRALELGATDSFETTLVRSNGSVVPVEVGSSPMVGDDGGVCGVQWIARDITERRDYEQRLMQLASRDHLTGLYNRRRFEDKLDHQLRRSRQSGTSGAVLWFDLDHFKDINDSLGHGAGDEVLAGVATALDERLRVDSMLARIGGDEFAVLMPIASTEEAEACAARVLRDIHDCVFAIGRREVRVTASVGIVVFPDQASTVEEALSRADLAMYSAKSDGRNRYAVYRSDENWDGEVRARFDWSVMIDKAIRDDGFIVYRQPILDITTGKLDRHELLIRLEDDDGTILAPGAFLAAAERTGQICEIDRWMVRRTIDLISVNSSKGRPCRLDVNLSGSALNDKSLLPLIEAELNRTGIDPSLFGIEITETAAVRDMGKAREFIETLKRLGCRVALDDFGSGFSSFYYLRNLPIDSLKIDGSFVQNMPKSRQDQHVVKAIVELAAGFGVESTAEYVEDETTLALLREYGVTHAQGFHIARPEQFWRRESPPDQPSRPLA